MATYRNRAERAHHRDRVREDQQPQTKKPRTLGRPWLTPPIKRPRAEYYILTQEAREKSEAGPNYIGWWSKPAGGTRWRVRYGPFLRGHAYEYAAAHGGLLEGRYRLKRICDDIEPPDLEDPTFGVSEFTKEQRTSTSRTTDNHGNKTWIWVRRGKA